VTTTTRGTGVSVCGAHLSLVAPLQVLHRIGENKKLGLSGRPNRPIGALGTSKVTYMWRKVLLYWTFVAQIIQTIPHCLWVEWL